MTKTGHRRIIGGKNNEGCYRHKRGPATTNAGIRGAIDLVDVLPGFEGRSAEAHYVMQTEPGLYRERRICYLWKGINRYVGVAGL